MGGTGLEIPVRERERAAPLNEYEYSNLGIGATAAKASPRHVAKKKRAARDIALEQKRLQKRGLPSGPLQGHSLPDIS